MGGYRRDHVRAFAQRLEIAGLYSKEAGDRLIADTKRKVEAGEPTTGWPSLVAALGEKGAKKVTEWLGVLLDGAQPKPVSGDRWNDDLHRHDRGDTRDVIATCP